jgi:spore coat protein U-like protein
MTRCNPAVLTQRTCQRLRAALLLPASVLLALAPAAHAATATATFQVTATVLKACVVTTPPTLAFGSYDANSATPRPGSTTFNVTCSSGTPYSVGLSAGAGTGATVTNRHMTSSTAPVGSNILLYGLFKDAGYTINWDNSASGIGYLGNGSAQTLTVFGQIPVNQYSAAPATDYLDTITLTLTY